MIGFSPVASVIAEAFGCKKILVDAQCLLFLIVFVPGNFLVIFALNNKQLQIGGSLSILGCWLRLLVQISGNFYLMIPGTIICAFAQAFFLNCGSKLATLWFGDKERALATAVGGLSVPLGSIMGFVAPALFFEGEGDKQQIFYKLSSIRQEPKMNLGKELRIILANKSYLLLSCTFIFMHGLYTTFGAVVSSITKPFGYKPIDNSIFGVIFTIFGLIGTLVFGIILDKYAKYKLITNIMTIGACISLSLIFWTLPTSNVLLHSANLAFAGFFITPIIPIGFAFSVELTFPVPESVSNGMMSMICQIYGTIMVSKIQLIYYRVLLLLTFVIKMGKKDR
ncbi:UNKNOWN [Stylonychia lemnae]|uniref:Major facilitator superfamily protein n=1 Tax=Stylonychia lemnae TaxID=5949 RepID=A0A078AQ71_STYLE|nr:UNKNOWN [Stylonychia lemnae]|eukprot:CDW84540.1 UNKNOWN [Stylonychia lemnae]